jgi:hypothetical protein
VISEIYLKNIFKMAPHRGVNSDVLMDKNGSKMINWLRENIVKNWKIFSKFLFKNVDMSNEKIMKRLNHYHRKS